MSIDGMREAWGPFFERTQQFYDYANPYLQENQAFEAGQHQEVEPLLDEMLEGSELIRRNADRVLGTALGEEYIATSNLLLAAATVDAMLARDLVTLDPERGEGRWQEIAGEESPYELATEREQTLDQVNRLFLGEERGTGAPGGGALGAGRRQLIEAADEVTRDLVDLAKGPSPDLLKGLAVAATGGAFEILAAAEHVDVLSDLKGAAAAVVTRAPRFLRQHAAKLLALRAEAKIVAEVANHLRHGSSIDSLLVWISGAEEAMVLSQQAIVGAPAISVEDAEALEEALSKLLPGYREQMGWIGKSAKWLRRGASPLTHLVAPIVGHAAIAGVFLLGLGYVAYSLTDRIDARDLGFAGRIEGVVPLVVGGV